jgi:hypothetical protein
MTPFLRKRNEKDPGKNQIDDQRDGAGDDEPCPPTSTFKYKDGQ